MERVGQRREVKPSNPTVPLNFTPHGVSGADLVELTWVELGCAIRPLRRTVFLRTDPIETKVGSLWLPPSATGFYSGMAHQQLVPATVLCAGPRASVKPGERIVFQRLHFARWRQCADGTMVGYVDSAQIAGRPVEG